MQQSLSFGSVAEDYERYRPGYSDDLVRLIIGRATGEVRRAITEVRQQTVPRRMIMPRDDYLRHLNTISACRMLSDADRGAILAGLAQRLPEQVPVPIWCCTPLVGSDETNR